MRRPPRKCRFLPAALAVGLWLGLVPGAEAQDHRVDLELVLAVDCSYSVDQDEFTLQARGIALAFRTSEVIDAILQGTHGAILVSVLQWSSQVSQEVVVPWTVVDSEESALALSVAIETMPRLTAEGATSLSGAVAAGIRLFDHVPMQGLRRVIDVSGDGRNNNGPALRAARNAAVSQGITVNGLAILNEVQTLHHYFREQLIGGTGAFVEVANRYADYAEAMKRKLVKEITFFPIAENRRAPADRNLAGTQPPAGTMPDSLPPAGAFSR